jgi:hypothetical protein
VIGEDEMHDASALQRFYGEMQLRAETCADQAIHMTSAQMQRHPCLRLTLDFTSFILRPSYFQGELRSGQLL